LIDNPNPDEKSIVAQVIEYYKYFIKGAANEQLLKVIFDNMRVANQLRQLRARYAYDASELLEWIAAKKAIFGNPDFPNFTEGLVDTIANFNEYLRVEKAEKNSKIVSLEALLQQIQSQTLNYGMKPFEPAPGQDIPSIKGAWHELESVEAGYKNAALTKYELFLRMDYNVRLFNSRAARVEAWMEENSVVFDASHSLHSAGSKRSFRMSTRRRSANNATIASVYPSVEECDTKLDAFAIFDNNFQAVSGNVSDLADIAAKITPEHGSYPQVVEELQHLQEKLSGLRNSGDQYKKDVQQDKENALKINALHKDFYVQAENLLFKIEGLEELVNLPVLEGSEEGLRELASLLSGKFAKTFEEAKDNVEELKTMAATLIAAGKSLNRDPSSFDSLLEELSSKFNARTGSLNLKIGVVRKHEDLKAHFAQKADEFAALTRSTSDQISGLSGTLENQLSQLASIEAGYRAAGPEKLAAAAEAWNQMEAAGILVCKNSTETIYSLNSRHAAILNSFSSGSTNITKLIAERDGAKAEDAARLEEIRKVFNFFDVDGNKVLRNDEFHQAVEGLGLIASEEKIQGFFSQYADASRGGVSFERFVDFVRANSASGSGKGDILNAFVTVVKSAPVITERDISTTFADNPQLVMEALADFPSGDGFDYRAYVDSLFA